MISIFKNPVPHSIKLISKTAHPYYHDLNDISPEIQQMFFNFIDIYHQLFASYFYQAQNQKN